MPEHVDPERLIRLRLVVARVGEMDLARWWNTQGVLGPRGGQLFRRGFPATRSFAQARVVFAVARSRCAEVFDPHDGVTLWSLPPQVEDQLEDRWQSWLDNAEGWATFFGRLASLTSPDLLAALASFELLTPAQAETVSRLRRGAEGRSVVLPEATELDDEVLTILAAGFARGEVGSPAVPYARLGGIL